MKEISTKVIFKNAKNIERGIAGCLDLLNPKLKKEILIKPNVVHGAPPGKYFNGNIFSTNVYVIKAVVEWLKSKGVKKIIIGEGSGSMNTTKEFKRAKYDLLDDLDVDFVDFNHDNYVKAKVPNALEWPIIEVAKTFYKAKYIINMPVAKCHNMTGVTLGIKNLMGALKPIGGECNGGSKSIIHPEWVNKSMPRKQAKELFERRLIDLLRVKPINLTLIDGTYGLEAASGNKISAIKIDKRAIKTDFLIASTDIISADIFCTKVMGFKPEEIYNLKKAQQVLGKRKINVMGDKPRFFNFGKPPQWLAVK